MDNPGAHELLQRLNGDTESPATDLLRQLRGEDEAASAPAEPRPEPSNYVPGEGRNPRRPKNPNQAKIDWINAAIDDLD